MKKPFLFSLLLLPAWATAQTVPIVESPASERHLQVFFESGAARAVDTRSVTLPAGAAALRLFGVPSDEARAINDMQFDSAPALKITAMRVGFPTEKGAKPLDLSEFLGETIGLLRASSAGEKLVSGKLIGLNPLLLDTADGVLLNPQGTWVLPRGRVTPVTPRNNGEFSEWRVESNGGPHTVNVRYTLAGLDWSARYLGTLDGSSLQLTGYVNFSLSNGYYKDVVRGATFILGSGQRFSEINLDSQSSRALFSLNLPVENRLIFQSAESAITRAFDFQAAQRSLSFDATQLPNAKTLPAGKLNVWRTDNSVFSLDNFDPESGTIPLGLDKSRSVARAVKLNKLLNPTTREVTIELRVSKGPALTLLEALPLGTKVTKTSLTPNATSDSKTATTLRWELPASDDDDPLVISYSVQAPA